jgi:hypothetical protein
VEEWTVENLSGSQSTISFRPLRRSDFPLLQRWLAAPHVARWWNERFDVASLEAKYGPGIDGREPIHVYLIQNESVPIGFNGTAGVIFQNMQFDWARTLARPESTSR